MRLESRNGLSRISLEGPASRKDYMLHENATFSVVPLDYNFPSRGLGINSSVFLAIDAETQEESVVKICSVGNREASGKRVSRRNRFLREIEANRRLQGTAAERGVIGFFGSGALTIGGDKYNYLLLRKADMTLADFLQSEAEIPLQQRLLICFELLRATMDLHQIGIYHRDLKPENIFFQDNIVKLGDLGLVAFRSDDNKIDFPKESIGPKWWMSPEAINRCQCIANAEDSFFETEVRGASDVYQLGKLFWYILQGDIPNGWVRSKDMKAVGDDAFGNILKPLLSYKANERPELSDVMKRMHLLRRRYAF